MKKFLVSSILFFGVMIFAQAQTPYTSTADNAEHPGGVVLSGVVSKYILQNNSAFDWYAGSQGSYKPDVAILNSMEAAKGKYQFVVFGGTWCEDTQNILPKFFKLQEQAGVADKDISFFAVNRDKQTLGNLAGAFKITNVPTIIVMKDGKEVGRVVEYGKSGKWDKDLADLLTTL